MNDNLSVEEIAYALGMMVKNQAHKTGLERAVGDLKKYGVLVEDNELGNGWKVLDRDGVHLTPNEAKGLVWATKGFAWAFWMGLGKPSGARIFCVASLEKESEAAGIDFAGDDGMAYRINGSGPSPLKLVQ